MAISDESLKHGYVISQILLEVSKSKDVSISLADAMTRSGYELSIYSKSKLLKKFGLFIKYSSKRASPWKYSFTLDHQTEIDILYKEYGEVFVVFVNKDDGVACLSHNLLKQILDDNHEEVEWVSIKSQLRKQYSISGKDGRLDKKISRNDFPRSIGLYVSSLVNSISVDNESPEEKSILQRLFGR